MSSYHSLTRGLAIAALTLLAAQSAHAQNAPKAKASQDASSSDGIEKAALTEAGAASSQQSAQSAIITNTTDPVNTSTAGLAAAIQAAEPRKWFGEFYTETSENMTDIEKGAGTPTLASYGGIKYDLGNGRAISLRQNFLYKSAQESGFGDFHIDNTVLNYTDGKLGTFWRDGQIILIARTYIPTGEKSRFVTKEMGKERLYLFEAKTLGKWDLTLVQLAQAFHWTQDSYMDGGKENQSTVAAGTLEFDAFYNITSRFSLGFIAGGDMAWLRPLQNKDQYSTDFYIQPTLQVIPTKGITAQVYLYNEVDTRAPTHSFALLRDDDNALQIWANLAASL